MEIVYFRAKSDSEQKCAILVRIRYSFMNESAFLYTCILNLNVSVLRLRGGGKKRKKKNYTTPKKVAHKNKKVKLAMLKYYKVIYSSGLSVQNYAWGGFYFWIPQSVCLVYLSYPVKGTLSRAFSQIYMGKMVKSDPNFNLRRIFPATW